MASFQGQGASLGPAFGLRGLVVDGEKEKAGFGFLNDVVASDGCDIGGSAGIDAGCNSSFRSRLEKNGWAGLGGRIVAWILEVWATDGAALGCGKALGALTDPARMAAILVAV